MRLRTSSSLITSVMVPADLSVGAKRRCYGLDHYAMQFQERRAVNMGYLEKRTVVVDRAERGIALGNVKRESRACHFPTRQANRFQPINRSPSSGIVSIWVSQSCNRAMSRIEVRGHITWCLSLVLLKLRRCPWDEDVPLVSCAAMSAPSLEPFLPASLTKHNANGTQRTHAAVRACGLHQDVHAWGDEAPGDGDNGFSCSNADVTYQIRLHDLGA
jgi:hypothetical protein